MTSKTDEIEAALRAGPLAILPKNCCQPVGEGCYYVLPPETKDALAPAVAAFIAEREAGLRKALAEQMDNTIAHQRRADVALDWNRLAVKQRDELQAKYDEAVNVARMNGAELDALRAQLRSVDERLARRPALDDLPTRTEKIERAINVAKEADALRDQNDMLRGAMAADDGRLREAERRVWKDPDMTWGCDAPEHLADTILELRAQLAERDTFIAECNSIRDRLEDIMRTHNDVIAERCAPDERHCSCVPPLRRELSERDRELELLREVELVARETRDAMDITLSSDDLDGEWQFENTVPIWHDRLANRLAALDTYRAQADKRGEGEK